MTNHISLALLFWLFLKFGLLCFGGGYMLVPLISAELVNGYGVLSKEQFVELVGIAQVTPGPIGINTATYVGFLQYGVFGAVIATAAIVLPSLFFVTLASALFDRWEKNILVQGFLAGMRPAAVGMVAVAFGVFAELSVFTSKIPFNGNFEGFSLRPGALAIMLAAAFLQMKTRIRPVLLILLCGAAGYLFC